MMMTCRLLCALLVLALCCCPSVCVADTELKDNENGVQEQGGGMSPPPPQPKVNNDKVNIQAVGKDVGESSLLLEGDQGKGHLDLPITGSVAKLGNGGGGGPVSTSTEGLGPNKVPNKLQADGNKGTTGPPSDKRLSEEQANSESEDSTEETTTTTKTTTQPTTTTTTTTQAPSTTTTEAPNTTTTRAPSRLREIDGSLSSSAWVCAPLLLAASALAYTTVG
ncbi:mucin TcMUCII [Trypanosoma cruzi cruzi]|uniref:Putative mucin TcMUCII n=1 Tax=Trypanosoma cruzi TaxID=5693 RepID=A0A2V2W3L6_TRYCR|nr:mucin TcMUCII [Trypanosoma cruzi cruzi]PWV03210.1 putative mucin TcMUCII [Trypanosoma cruzi]